MLEQLSRRIRQPSKQCKMTVFTDGNDDYVYALLAFYDVSCVNYGQLIKIREKGTVVDKKRMMIYGCMDLDEIETTDVENFNGILRERVGRLVRKTKCFAKLKRRLTCSITVFQFYWNFISELERKRSPGMMEGLTDHVWTWHEFLHQILTITD